MFFHTDMGLVFGALGLRNRGKVYRFVVNGRTGQVQGERPYSIAKIAGAVLLGLAVAGLIALLGSGGG